LGNVPEEKPGGNYFLVKNRVPLKRVVNSKMGDVWAQSTVYKRGVTPGEERLKWVDRQLEENRGVEIKGGRN